MSFLFKDWKLRLAALKRLQGLVLGSCEVLRPVLPRCREALLAQLQDLRSTLVREVRAEGAGDGVDSY